MRGTAAAACFIAAAGAALSACMGPPKDGEDMMFRKFYLDTLQPMYSAVPLKDGGSEYRLTRVPGLLLEPFRMPKPAGTTRIFVAGGSVAQNFHEWPEGRWDQRLGALSGGGRFEVIDAGIGGYGSHLDLEVLREILEYSPDAVVMMTGNNEWHRPPVLAHPRLAYLAWRARRLPVLGGLLARLSPATREYTRAERERDFEDNVRAMARLARERGVPLLLCTLPNALSAFPPGGMPEKDPDQAAGLAAQAAGRAREAARLLAKAAAAHPDSAFSQFYLGKALELAGRAQESRPHYEAAADLDQGEHHCPPARNALLRRIAREEGVLLADLDAAFARLDPAGGLKLFYDRVHWHHEYNPFVAAVLTETLAGALERQWDRGAIAAWRQAASAPAPNDDGVFRILYLAGRDLLQSPGSRGPLELADGLDRYRPGTLERLPEVHAAFRRFGLSQDGRDRWGVTSETFEADERVWWPQFAARAAEALRREGKR